MSYSVKEIFLTLQGEGANSGRPAVFCRFSGCNLWSGREEDRSSAICQFCDTSFVGMDGQNGGRFSGAADLVAKIASIWGDGTEDRFVVLTGGEPMLQADDSLVQELKRNGFTVAIETNGTIPIDVDFDWVCVSPKAGTKLAVTRGNELKLVYPQFNIDPSAYLHLDFQSFYLQPMDSEHIQEAIKAVVNYCLENPKWRLSFQMHKAIGID